MKNKRNKGRGIISVLFLIFTLIFIFGCTFLLGTGILKILGFTYKSMSSLIVFFMLYMFFSFITDIIGEVFLGIVHEFGPFSKMQFNLIKLFFIAGFNMISLSMAEGIVDGVVISDRVIIIYGLISYLIEMFFDSEAGKLEA